MDVEKMKEELRLLIVQQLTRLYDFPESFTVQPLKYSENVIYKITFSEKGNLSPVVLRVHRPGYHTEEELISEMVWMEEIARDTDIALPQVYRGRSGALMERLHGTDGKTWNCSVISFLEGRLLEELSDDELPDVVEQVGEITAKLHLQSMNRDEGVELVRYSWDIHNFFDEDGVWGSWRAYKPLGAEQREILELCQQKMTARLMRYGKGRTRYGMIHSDLHFCNIMRDGDVNQIFDFDDCGYGYYLYDLGCTLVTCSRNLKSLQEAWLKGYEKIRKLSDEDKELLPMFVLLRRIVRFGWLASHAGSDTEKRVGDEYVPVTIEMAKEWLMQNS